jgi:hypothetical protein
MTERSQFRIRPAFYPGAWLTEHRRYFEYLGIQLAVLGELQDTIDAAWPVEHGEAVQSDEYPELHRLCRRRDAAKDSIIVFCAMSVEAAVNYYGVRRFGAKHFEEHFERLPLYKKLRLLLLLCDGIELEKGSPVLRIARRIGKRRNDLVHPKTRDAPEDISLDQRIGRPSADLANEAIADCDAFFTAFFSLVPQGSDIDPRPRTG